MADSSRTPADSLDQLRRSSLARLLGAAVLILAAIIAVPMFLEREPPLLPDQVDIRIPPVEGTKFEPKAEVSSSSKKSERQAVAPATSPATPPQMQEPAGEKALPPPVTAATSATAQVSAAREPIKPQPEAPSAVSTPPPPKLADPSAESAATQAKPSQARADPPRRAGQLVVQLIAVRDAAAAKEVAERARKLKYPVYTEVIDVVNGKVTRVRVGPYDSKQAAEAARARLAREGFEAKIVTLQ